MAEPAKIVKLESHDGVILEVPIEIAKMSVTIKNMLEGLFWLTFSLFLFVFSCCSYVCS